MRFLCTSAPLLFNKYRPRIAAVLLLGLACFGQSRADECDKLPLPSVTVKRLEVPLTMNFDYSYKALTTIGPKAAQSGHQVLGLTRSNAIVQFETKMPSLIDRTGNWECASPQLTLTFGYQPMTLYVAREFPAGTCAYQEIYAHEQRHVKTYLEHLAGIEKELTETLKRRFATGAVWRAKVGQTQARLEKELDERWVPYLKREMARVELAQAQIDTAEEYARIGEACNGEIKRLLR